MSNYEKIRTEDFLDGKALKVVLNAPKANVLDGQMMAEILDLLQPPFPFLDVLSVVLDPVRH